MQEIPNRIKRLVREWAGIAHDRDLRKALTELGAQFDRWERGEIDSFELNELVHRFHQDTSREIWKRYAPTHLEAPLRQPWLPVCFGRRNCRRSWYNISPA
jgi:hypothetical protein